MLLKQLQRSIVRFLSDVTEILNDGIEVDGEIDLTNNEALERLGIDGKVRFYATIERKKPPGEPPS